MRQQGGKGVGVNEWPERTGVLDANRFPSQFKGIPIGGVAAVFHIDSFAPETTRLQGFISLTNLTKNTNSILLCLDGDAISYHIELRDASGRMVNRWAGIHHNWAATALELGPQAVVRKRLDIVLKDFFEIGQGVYELLFVYDERMLGRSHAEGSPIMKWTSEALVIHCQ